MQVKRRLGSGVQKRVWCVCVACKKKKREARRLAAGVRQRSARAAGLSLPLSVCPVRLTPA